MLHTKKNFLKSALAVFCMVSMLLFSSYNGITTVYAASGYEYVLLTKYSKTMKIGDEYYLTAITSTGKKPKFSSSDSTVASVNTYGKITAKKAGNATITAKLPMGRQAAGLQLKNGHYIKSEIHILGERIYGPAESRDINRASGHVQIRPLEHRLGG